MRDSTLVATSTLVVVVPVSHTVTVIHTVAGSIMGTRMVAVASRRVHSSKWEQHYYNYSTLWI